MIIKKIYFLIINQLVLTKKKYLKNKFNIPNYNKINGDDIDKSDEREHQKNKLSYKGIPIVEKYKYVPPKFMETFLNETAEMICKECEIERFCEQQKKAEQTSTESVQQTEDVQPAVPSSNEQKDNNKQPGKRQLPDTPSGRTATGGEEYQMT